MAFRVYVEPPDGRPDKRVVRFKLDDLEHVDKCDPRSGFERGKVIERLAAKMHVAPEHFFGLDEAIQKAAERTASAATSAISYPSMTGAELDAEEYAVEYLIPGVLAAGQHAVGGGQHKSLKTLILGCDLGISLAIGGHFLGYFPVSRPVRTCLMSGECGYPVVQEYLRRVARAAGTELRQVGNLLISDHLPMFGRTDHTEAMGRFLTDNGIEVLILDPMYLCLPGEVKPGDVFSMGTVLRGMAEVFVEHKATLLILHHATKPAGRDGTPIDLADLQFSGFAQFAAQWTLLSRRRPYVPGTGHHELWLSVGGRAGHSGLWGLDVDEGEYQHGVERQWQVAIRPADDVRQDAQSSQEARRCQAKQERDQARAESDRMAVVAAMVRLRAPDSRNVIRERAGLGHGGAFARAWASLLNDKTIQEAGTARRGNVSTALYELTPNGDI